MTPEKFDTINSIRNKIIVAEQEHKIRVGRLWAEIHRLGCDHRDPDGQLFAKPGFGMALCKLCEEQCA